MKAHRSSGTASTRFVSTSRSRRSDVDLTWMRTALGRVILITRLALPAPRRARHLRQSARHMRSRSIIGRPNYLVAADFEEGDAFGALDARWAVSSDEENISAFLHDRECNGELNGIRANSAQLTPRIEHRMLVNESPHVAVGINQARLH